MEQTQLIPHLFRTEYQKIVAVLCKRFGLEQIEIAEDIASDTFLTAAQTWGINGLPVNPTAWLYNVAKNKTINHLRRTNTFDSKIIPALKHDTAISQQDEIDLSPQNIADSQLQMMFAICHPSITTESQIGLALRILCGFGIEEIATAFLSNKETISKRLFRAKEKLREEKVQIEFPAADEINKRLETVLTTLYLLFNEGYYSESQDAVLREDLCLEAMRLAYLLIENEQTNLPPVNALLSLMCFHASRFAARKNSNGEIVLYEDQDETLWNQELITKGVYFLRQASQGDTLSRYHLEASIAYWHTQKTDTAEKWENILQLYNRLLQLEYSPIAALNRTYALSKANGKAAAIIEAEKLQLTENYLYHSLLGELYSSIDFSKARNHFEMAVSLAKTTADKDILSKKINNLYPVSITNKKHKIASSKKIAKPEKEIATAADVFSSLSAPAQRALASKGIKTVKELSAFSEAEILKLHGIGKSSMPLLNAALQSKGLSFKKINSTTKTSDTASVDDYMKKLKHPLKNVAEALRKLIMATDKSVGEEIAWNAPSFFYTGAMKPFNPKEYKRFIVVFNFLQQDCIRLIFLSGAKLNDASGLLEGDYADGRRLALFHSMDDVKANGKTLQKLVKKWLQLLEK